MKVIKPELEVSRRHVGRHRAAVSKAPLRAQTRPSEWLLELKYAAQVTCYVVDICEFVGEQHETPTGTVRVCVHLIGLAVLLARRLRVPR
jgi:hypothetical protein